MFDPISSTACCILGGVRAAIACEGLTPPEHVYMSTDLSVPACANHGFATIRWSGSRTTQRDATGRDCLTRRVDSFDLRVGQCAPPSVNRYLLEQQQCNTDLFANDCPPCDADLTTYTEPPGNDGCVAPLGAHPETGELLWPLPANPPSYSDYSRRINSMGLALRRHLKAKVCACFQDCYKAGKKTTKQSVAVGDVIPWCEGCFAGVDITLEVYLPDIIPQPPQDQETT